MSNTPGHTTRASLLLSACFLAAPQLAYAQTTVSGAQTTQQSVSGNGTVTVTPTGSIVVPTPTASQAVNINASSLGTGVVITVERNGAQQGRIESVSAVNNNGRAINSSGDFADRTVTINNAGQIIGGNDAISFRPTTATTAATGTVTINNSGTITGNSGNGFAQAAGSQAIEQIVLGTGLVVNNLAGGTISGSQGILSSAATTVITNAGTITGTAGAGTQGEAIRTNLVNVSNTSVGSSLNLTNTGNITGVYGIIATGPNNTIVNGAGGVISGSNVATTGTSGNITREAIRINAGVVATGATGFSQVNTVSLLAGSTTTAGTNPAGFPVGTGTASASGNAVVFGGTVPTGFTATNTLNIEVGAVINGNIVGGGTGATDTLNLQGTGSQVLGSTTNFDILNVQGGTWGITNSFTLTGPATIAAGATLRYDDAGASGGSVAGAITNNGTLIQNRTSTVTHTAAITGSGAVQVINTGGLNLAGANTYSGATTISNGTLRTGQQNNSLSANSSVTVVGSGALELNDNTAGAAVARDNAIANLSGSGTVRLGLNNAATLTTGSGGGDTTFAGVFTQTGNLTKVGTGTLTLSGNSAATGLLTLAGGGIALSGQWDGAATVANGTALSGAGRVAGPLTIGAASISPGNGGIGTLTVGGLVLSAGSQLNFEFGAPGTDGTPGASDRIAVNGALTLDGTLNVTDVGGFGVGVYRLITYTPGPGSLTNNGLDIGSIPSGTTPGLFSIQTSVAGRVNLIYGAPAPTSLQFWDGADLTGNGAVDGGSGSWTNSLPNWTDQNGAGNTAWTGNFAVFQGAAGTVTVDDAISFTGAQFVTDGYQVVAGTGALSAANALTTIRVDPTVTATITANIGGTGGLLKNDGGTLVLGGTNGYAGTTTVLGGTLRVTGGNAITDTSSVSLATGSTLDVAASEAIGELTGTGAVTLTGGTLTTGALGGASAFDGVVSGTGGLTKAGTGTFTLNAVNTYAGATTVNAGTLALGASGNIGAGDLTVATGATFAANGRATSVGNLNGGGTVQLGTNGALTLNTSGFVNTFSGSITGPNATLTRNGTGFLVLSGVNDIAVLQLNGGPLTATVTGAIGTAAAVTIAAPAVLQITADQSAASLAGGGLLALDGATLTVNGAASTTYSGNAQGTGGLTKAGTGTLTLSGANTYTGNTAVTGGTLLLDGSVAGPASVATGGVLAGGGSVAGVVTVADGRLSPGAGAVGTLTTGGLLLGAGSNLDYQLGAPGSTGDRLQVNGSLTLDGTLNVTDIGGFGPGVYRLIDYTGALTDNGLLLGTLPGTVTRSRVAVQTGVATQINLVVGDALPAIQFWDGPNTVSNGVIDGGSGSWNNVRTSWTDLNGQNNAEWGGQFAVFSGATGTVTVDDAIQFSGMQFTTSGYVIAAGTGTLTATQAQTNIRTDAGVTATIGAAIGGAGGLNKVDAGTLILTGANGYAGTTTVAGGTLRAGGAGALPTGTAVTVAGGATLDITTSQTIASLAGAGAVTLTGGGLTTGGAGTDTSFTGVISGTGALTKTGAGVFTLGGANSFSGGATVAAGTLRLASGGSFGSGPLTVATGAVADLAGNAATVGGLNGAGSVTLGAATLTVAGPGSFAGVVSGTGGLIKSGTGTLTLSGVNTYTGATSVTGGTLGIGTGTIPAASAVTVGTGATLALNGSAQIASLNGAGAVALGANTLTLGTGTFTGAIGGTGGVTKTGAGTLTLGGVSTYTGATAATGGTLALTGTNAIAASSGVALTGGARLDIAGGGAQSVGGLTGVTGTTVVLGANTLTVNNAAANAFAGIVSGTGGLVKTGAGTLTLSAANTHSGGTTVGGGTLQAGATNAFGPGVLTVTAPGSANLVTFTQSVAGLAGDGAVALGTATLTVNGAATTTYGGVLSGTGGLTRSGTGSLTLGGANTYTGATSVTGGTLLVNGSLASSVTVGNAGRLGGTGTVAAITATGTVAPGAAAAIGTLRVAGTVNLGATSILEVRATPAGTADQLAATGAVTLAGGGVQVRTGGATGYTPLNTYTILTGSTVTGTFGSVTSDAAFLTPSLVYNPASVQLRLVRNDISFASIGQTPNQSAAGAAIQTQQSGTLFDRVVVLAAADARVAFDQLSGEIHAGTAMLARREGHANGRAILDRLETATGTGLQLWIEGSAGSTTVDGRDGFATVDASRIGIAGGAEIAGGGTRGGIGFRHASADIDVTSRNSNGDLELSSAFVYLGHDFGALRFGVAGSIGFLRAETERNVAFTGFTNRLTASEKGQSFTGTGEIAFLPAFGGFRAGPYASISYVDTVLDGTTEAGGAGALAVEKVEDSTGSASYGLRGVGTLGAVTVLADIGGRSYLDDLGQPRTLRFNGFDPMFAVSPAGYAKTTVNARLELGFGLGPVRMGVGGRAEVGRDTTSYAGRVSAGIRF